MRLAQGLDPTRHETKRGLRGASAILDPQGEAPAPGPCSLQRKSNNTLEIEQFVTAITAKARHSTYKAGSHGMGETHA
jgi:hypothetical protein